MTQKRGVLVIDRGGDARALLEDWIDQEYRFVVRLRGDRDLLRFYESFGGPATTVQIQREGQWVRVEARQLARMLLPCSMDNRLRPDRTPVGTLSAGLSATVFSASAIVPGPALVTMISAARMNSGMSRRKP